VSDPVDENLPPSYLFKKTVEKIDPDDPWATDRLSRQQIASDLDEVLSTVNQPMVMTLTADYGMGKTTFLQSWQAQIAKRNEFSVIFNAWETDFSKDAFVAFVSAIESQFSNKSGAKKKFLKSAKKLGGAIVKNSPGFAAKVVAKVAIGEKGVEALENFELTEGDAVKLAEGIATEAFKSQRKVEKSIKSFRDSFKDIVDEQCDGKLIVFIDELDRCSPKYAVEVLESIKHTFSVQGVIFVLAVDDAQLVSSFKGVYGQDLNAKGYFSKFIDWSFRLPEPDVLSYSRHLSEQIFDFEGQGYFLPGRGSPENIELFHLMVFVLAKVLGLSLRDVDRSYTYVNLALRKCKSKAYSNELAIVAFLKVADKDLYYRLFSKSSEIDFNTKFFE